MLRTAISSTSQPLHLFSLRPALRSLVILFQCRFRSRSSDSSWTSVWLRVSESGRGLPAVMIEPLEADPMVVGDVHGSGSCIARKPETKHPPYAWRASREAALLRSMLRLASRFPSSDSAQ